MFFKKIAIFGGTGLLGSEFKKVLEAENFDFSAPKSNTVNLENFEQTQKFIKNGNFDLIVCCAAYTKVDLAEKENEKCKKLNVESLKNIMELKIPIIHFSSDYVFSALENFEIPENFPKNPPNFYGKTKALAEEVLEKAKTPFWNIRTGWLFGENGKNFVTTILDLAEKNEGIKISIVDDQIGRPTFTKDLAKFVVENFIKTVQPSGHYHLQNAGIPVSWADFAQIFLEKSGKFGKIEKVSSAVFPQMAKRPKNSVLKNTKLEFSLRDWHLALDEFLEILALKSRR